MQHLIGIVAPGRRLPHRSPTARSGGPVPLRARFHAHAGRSRPVVGTATDTGNSPDPADSGCRLPASASLHAPVRAAGSGIFHRPQHPMPLPPPVRVGPDFPFVSRSGLGVENHLEDFLVQGLEQAARPAWPGHCRWRTATPEPAVAVRSPSSGTAPTVRPAWSHILDAPSRTPAGK